jgi:SAM-dependent methyltransferase
LRCSQAVGEAMKPDEKSWINDRYDKRIAERGFSIEGLASGTIARREIRYQVLLDVGIVSGSTVLDVGCGLGDFGVYLRSRNLEVKYTGVDINPTLIAECRRRYPWGDFHVADIEDEYLGRYDFVVSSSCFNLKYQRDNNYERIASVLAAMFSHMKNAVAIDMLSSWVDYKGNVEEAFYYDPSEVFSLAKLITKSVLLRHDYPLFEFCMYLFPDFQGWAVNATQSHV